MAGKSSSRPSSSRAHLGEKRGGLLGLGLDARDGHERVTKGEDFLLLGGSEQTHERMQDVVMRMREKMKRRGKNFADLSHREFEDLARDSL
ncbi:MAG: hypothetical protein ACYTG6_18195 [Planctomycetota bacterium]|jgi:hypothetical protein